MSLGEDRAIIVSVRCSPCTCFAGAAPVLTVRRFFAQVAAAAPGGLTIDFSAWQGATVDRFFLALMAPERTRRRGPAMADTVSLSGAFDGFEWD